MCFGSRTTSGHAHAVCTVRGNSWVEPTTPKESSCCTLATSSQQNCSVSSTLDLGPITQRVSSRNCSPGDCCAGAAAPPLPGSGGFWPLASLAAGVFGSTGAGADCARMSGVRILKYLAGRSSRRAGGRSMRWRLTGGGIVSCAFAASWRARSVLAADSAASVATGTWSLIFLSVSSREASHGMTWNVWSSSVVRMCVYRRR
mmetsp:Transcript_33853/g.104527  ORF Transcript_33853/g.104527 Transcript_33853/m.104527 type:complete len:202 (+) Transcript_33853:472-1077(+)